MNEHSSENCANIYDHFYINQREMEPKNAILTAKNANQTAMDIEHTVFVAIVFAFRFH